jgi:hypothetical protein
MNEFSEKAPPSGNCHFFFFDFEAEKTAPRAIWLWKMIETRI